MRTFRAIAAIPAAALLLVACGDEETTKPTTLAIGGVTTLVTDTSSGTGTGTDTDDGSTDTVADGPLQIDVLVGTNSGADRIERVKVGNQVTLTITNPNSADSYHVHGYDLEQEVAKGVAAIINFTADEIGRFEVESHITEDVLVVIEVS
ncbi:MAG: hypothetical protein Q7V57_02695 [Actinomycetota bacterium]|nr:hypothetical protein [Actinomycetota bacterium]